ncbi:hypothetical protein [Allopontixanthobacter sediminis]|uniref:Uncharacterized protein n=1 Tax=Allopontixanthobacter sediminis TaxID=1689985 RepID=A0A845B0K2_9SPHN|nr:hypothetical protein [Allopontixanthobacter sediminis]MXP42957.1 hypothetical protein [Allopontixanthobacter sediminis]
MTQAEQLAARIRAKASEMNISASTLSRKLFGGGSRIDEIEAGSSLTLDTFARVSAALDDLDRDKAA